MLNHKYVSCFEIIRNLYRDTGLTFEIPQQDAIEFSAEALDLIGAPQQFIDKCKVVKICDYQGKIPCDLHLTTTVAEYTPSKDCLDDDDEDSNVLEVTQLLNETNQTVTLDASKWFADKHENDYNALTITNTFASLARRGRVSPMTWSSSVVHSSSPCESGDCEATYTLNNNYIFTNFKDGYVVFYYKGFPVDDCGYPMIPDNTKVKIAVMSYLRMKIDYILWRRNDISSEVYRESQTEWAWYVGAAKTASQIPDLDRMETWKNQTLRLLPKVNAHSSFYGNLGYPEQLGSKGIR